MKWLFEYQLMDNYPYETEIKAKNLNEALITFGKFYHNLKAIGKITLINEL